MTLTPEQCQARKTFDIDVAMAALPAPSPIEPTGPGQAGLRLSSRHVADIEDSLLIAFARETLGAQRFSPKYLDALRIVLGNQAQAERQGYVLEMNQRVSFAAPNVMRNIVDQMRRAGIASTTPIGLGVGRRQVVQCFRPAERPACDDETEATDYGERPYPGSEGPTILEADVPY